MALKEKLSDDNFPALPNSHNKIYPKPWQENENANPLTKLWYEYKKEMLKAVEQSFATSTDLADWLVKNLNYQLYLELKTLNYHLWQ